MSASSPPLSFLDANGVRFAYHAEGAGPLVLLLHGFPDTPQTWDRTRPVLAKAGYRAVSPFQRGYAPSAIPADGKYDMETLGRDVVGILDALGEKRAIVVGHDWGATAAYAAASMFPDRVSLLVTLAIPFPGAMVPTPGMVWSLRHFFALGLLPGAASRVRARDFAYIDTLLHRWSPAWSVPPGEADAVKRALREPGHLEAALGYYRALRYPPPRALRERIHVPTVCFMGTNDIMSPAIYERARRWFTARYEVVRLPGGHFMHREHPERFHAELLAVIEKLTPS